MSTRRYIDNLARLIDRATQHGAERKSQTRWHWVIDPKCESPAIVEMAARPSPDRRTGSRRIVVKRHSAHSLVITIEAPCRKCKHCQRKRSHMWRERAKLEMAQAHRTWLATYTLAPEYHYVMQARANARALARGVKFSELTPEEQFRRVNHEGSLELTLMVKRLRKNTKRPLRYLLVTERHKSGYPHWHMLIHEEKGPVTYRQLQAEWTLGFTNFKLLKDIEAAGYVAKYLSKSMQARVRASLRYGRREARP